MREDCRLCLAISQMPQKLAFQRTDERTGHREYHCNRCQRYYPSLRFAPSSLRRGVPYCRPCRSQMNHLFRHKSPDHETARCLYELERRRYGRRGGHFDVQVVSRLLDQLGRRSALSGKQEALRLRRFWPDLPFSVDNAVVLTARENNALARTHDWLARFPPSLVDAMVQRRQAALVCTV